MNINSYDCCMSKTIESKNLSLLSILLKIMSEKSRLKILCILRKDSCCIWEFEKYICLSHSLIFHYLTDLKDVEIVNDKKKVSEFIIYLLEKVKKLLIHYVSYENSSFGKWMCDM